VGAIGFPRDPGQVGLRSLEACMRHGQSATAGSFITGKGGITTAIGGAGLPLVVRDRKPSDSKVLTNRDTMLWPFTDIALRLGRRCSHDERAFWHHHHFRTDITFLEAVLRF